MALGIGLGLELPWRWGALNGGVTNAEIAALFSGGIPGAAYVFNTASLLYTDSARTTLVTTAGDPIGSVTDISGNNNHAGQATAGKRFAWQGGYATLTTDDVLSTGNIDFSGVDGATVAVGIRKNSDAATGYVLEHGANVGTARGVYMTAPPFNGGAGFGFGSRGSTLASANDAPGNAAPLTAVVSGRGRISTDQCILRVNGVQTATAVADQGTGNYLNSPLHLGAGGGGTSLYFNGRYYGAFIIGKVLTAGELTLVERWLAQLTGNTIP